MGRAAARCPEQLGTARRLPISDLDLYLLSLGVYTLGVYTLEAYSLGPPILDLAAHLPVLKKSYRGPFNVKVV